MTFRKCPLCGKTATFEVANDKYCWYHGWERYKEINQLKFHYRSVTLKEKADEYQDTEV